MSKLSDYFNWLTDKKLFRRLFLHCFFTQIMAWVVLVIFMTIPLPALRAEMYPEKDPLPEVFSDAVLLLLKDKFAGGMTFVLLTTVAISSLLSVKIFFDEINLFGDNPEWRGRFIAEKIKTEKNYNILLIVITLCLTNYISFAGT